MLQTIFDFLEQLIHNPATNGWFAVILSVLGAGIGALIYFFGGEEYAWFNPKELPENPLKSKGSRRKSLRVGKKFL